MSKGTQTMASNSKKNKTEEKPVETNEVAPAEDTPSSIVHEKITAKVLFAEYEEKDATYARIAKELELAQQERSQAVKKILENVGKGPFRYKGSIVTVVGRTTTSPDGDHTTYFFKGQKLAVQDVD